MGCEAERERVPFGLMPEGGCRWLGEDELPVALVVE